MGRGDLFHMCMHCRSGTSFPMDTLGRVSLRTNFQFYVGDDAHIVPRAGSGDKVGISTGRHMGRPLRTDLQICVGSNPCVRPYVGTVDLELPPAIAERPRPFPTKYYCPSLRRGRCPHRPVCRYFTAVPSPSRLRRATSPTGRGKFAAHQIRRATPKAPPMGELAAKG